MLTKVESTSDVMLIVDLSLARVVQHSPFQFYGFAYTVQAQVVSQIACVHMVQCGRMCMTTITLRTQN